MPLQFPSNPNLNDSYTYGGVTFYYDGKGWNIADSGGASVTVANSKPTTTQLGSLWLDDDSGKMYAYFGGNWAQFAAGGGGGGGGGVAAVYDIVSTSTGYFDLPTGNTAQRPSSPPTGAVRYNSTTGLAEVYTALGWGSFGAQPPIITTVSPASYNGAANTEFTVNGSNFTSDAVVKFLDNNGNTYVASSVTFVNAGTLLARTPQIFTVAQEPLDVQVAQLSGSVTKLDCIDCGGVPTWNTTAGNLGVILHNVALSSNITLSAGDPDSQAVTYSLAPGSSLPTGLVLSSSGVISGNVTLADTYSVNGVTYNFTVLATDASNNSTSRAFSLLKYWVDGFDAFRAADSAARIKTSNPAATNGFYWIKQTGATAYQHYCVFKTQAGTDIDGGPWTVPFVFNIPNSNFSTTASTSFTYFSGLCTGIGISTPGRGMESTRTTTEVYGAWLAAKRAIWEGYTNFVSGKSSAAGGVLTMPMLNSNGEGGTSAHRLVYDTSLSTHIPPNSDGDRCDQNQLFCGWWGVNDVASWTTNNDAVPGPEDWGPTTPTNGSTNTSYGYTGYTPMAVCCIYR